MSIKKYTNGEVVVLWEAGKCIHSANCVKGMPGVFKPKERPWIQAENADSNELKKVVANCPSGALRIEGSAPSTPESGSSSKAVVIKDGPLMVTGSITVEYNGNVELKDKVFLCRCGASISKPYCDGSHKKIDFKG